MSRPDRHPDTESLFAVCGPGLEGVLRDECVALGFTARAVPGGCELEGPKGAFRTLNLWSRVASRVLLRLAEVRTPEELARVDLSPFVPAGAEVDLQVAGQVTKAFDAALARQVKLREAGEGGGASTPPGVSGGPGANEGRPAFLMLRGHAGRVSLSIDTSGDLLHFRGYRQEVGRAPMRETLAAGVLRLAGWTPGTTLGDVMCGSGTLLIEAAEQARGLAPGRNRRFGFEAFPSHDAAAFAGLARERGPTPTRIVGTDLNSGALGTARRNARRAGVFEALALERADATKLTPELVAKLVPPSAASPGLVVANLPYGKRVNERSELGALYRGLGQSLRRALPGWRFAFLLEEGEQHLGLTFDGTAEVGNGGLSCAVVWGRVPSR